MKKEKMKERKKFVLKPAVKYTLVAAGFISLLAVLILFHFLFRSGRIDFTENYREQLLRLQSSYRSATAVVDANCINPYESENNSGYAEYVINRVISGEKSGLEKGMKITVKTDDNDAERHLLYIKSEGNAFGSGVIYTIVDDSNFIIDKGKIVIDGKASLPYDVFIENIEEIRKDILLPTEYYYYRSFSSLIKKSDLIFIGKVIKVEEEERVKCITIEAGEEQTRMISVTTVEAEVMNGLESGKKYGERVIIKIPEFDIIPTLDFITNKSFYSEDKNYALDEGDVCLFFLDECKDFKEKMYFLVNDYQGYIKTAGDFIFACSSNVPFKENYSLYDAVKAILEEK